MSSLLPLMIILLFLSALAIPIMKRIEIKNPALLLAILPTTIFVIIFNELLALDQHSLVLIESGWGFMNSMEFTWRLDGLSIIFALIISGVGSLVLIYSYYYMAEYQRKGHFYTYLMIFMGAMLGLVLTDNLMVLFIFWELTSVSAFFLIGFHHHLQKIRQAAQQALLVNTFGGLSLLFAVILTGHIAQTYRISQLLDSSIHLGNHPHYYLILILVLLAATTKSAQFPFHFWLPKSMTSPTPINIYLYSATLVNTGVFLLFRLHPIMGGTFIWRYVLILMGGISMFLGAFLAMGQRDFKRILAYTTISTLGIMVLLIGMDTPISLKAALLLFIIHALYKGSLFMVAGIVYKSTGTHKIYRIGGMLKHLPITALITLLALVSMAGLPMLGSIGKDLIYDAKLQIPVLNWVLIPMGVGTNILMVGISIVLIFELFVKRSTPHSYHMKRSERSFPHFLIVAPAILAITALLLGIAPTLLELPITNALYYVHSRIVHSDLSIWHGFNEVLVLNIFTVLSGFLVFILRRPISFQIFKLTKWLNKFTNRDL